MTLTRTGLTLALAACTLPCVIAAQTATFTDPANLRGERVRPSDGRELPVDLGRSGLQQLLRKLNTRASLMLIVAHPDDEDGGMLTFYSRGLGARVAMLTLNRGEGGQNAMTGDFEDALGLLRTQELLSADRYFDVDQMFGTEVDFGFSKTKEEAFAKWTHQRVLYDAVRVVRLYRPLVIASVFVGGVTDGHGQHQVSGQIAQEVFNAAGDPKVFPELTAEGILPWKPLKVYARVPMQSITPQGLFDYATGQYTPAKFTNYVTGEVTTTVPSVDVIVHEGIPDPLLDGKSYVQFARIGLGLQRSQIGPGVRNAPPGAFDVSYHLYGSYFKPSTTVLSRPERNEVDRPASGTAAADNPAPLNRTPPDDATFFDGIDTSIEGIASLSPEAKGAVALALRTNLKGIAQKITSAQREVSAGHTDYAVTDLTTALTILNSLIKNLSTVRSDLLPADQKENVLHELRIKGVQLNDAIVLALGLHMNASATSSDLVTKTTVPVHIIVSTDTGQRIPYFSEELETSTGTITRGPMSDGDRAITRALPWTADLDANPMLTRNETRPYFFRENIEQPTYQLHNIALRNAPSTPPALIAWVNLVFDGVDFKIGRVVESKAQAIEFVPPASLSLAYHAQVLSNDVKSFNVQTFLYPIEKPALKPDLALPAGWKSNVAISEFNAPGQMGFAIHVPNTNRSASTVEASVDVAHHTYTEGYRPIGYGDLPRTNYYTSATVRVVPVDLKLPTRNRIAYLPGTGDDVPGALTSIGLSPTILTVADITPAALAQYETVILGVRTYNAHPDLHGAPTQALLDYARDGGNVIVQFQTSEFTAADAPYPLTLGRAEVVVDETAPVQILAPTSPLFNTPNKITPADFNNWIEERGHGFLRIWDSHYSALTETHDPGGSETQPQAPQFGGLITTTLGKGRWTYCAFALYRQLPEAVPGAYRLFVNLLNP